jgi:hypothetical protein
VDLFEDAGEVVGILEADGAAGGFDCIVGAQEQFLGMMHAQAGEELRGGLSGVLSEKARKVFRANVAGSGCFARTAHLRVVCREVIPATVEDMAALCR